MPRWRILAVEFCKVEEISDKLPLPTEVEEMHFLFLSKDGRNFARHAPDNILADMKILEG